MITKCAICGINNERLKNSLYPNRKVCSICETEYKTRGSDHIIECLIERLLILENKIEIFQ
jgi:hypothetical protein